MSSKARYAAPETVLRITTQLVESSTRHSVWAERYDRQMEDVFAVQEEISLSIAKALEITLSPQEEKVIARKPTDNPQAYDFFLRGRNYLRQRQFEYSLAMYEEAVKLDPNSPSLMREWRTFGAECTNSARRIRSSSRKVWKLARWPATLRRICRK